MSTFYLGDTSIKDQKDQDSCTGCSVATAVEVLTKCPHSEDFVMYGIDWLRRDKTIESACMVANSIGVCKWETYRGGEVTGAAFSEAKNYKTSSPVRVRKFEEVVMALEMGMPVVMSVPFDLLMALELEVPEMPRSKFHAVCCVGYDGGRLRVRNSWGRAWNQGGDFYVPSLMCGGIRAAYAISL